MHSPGAHSIVTTLRRRGHWHEREPVSVAGEVRPTVVRVVTLASSSGAYGGPFDTAVAQAKLARDAGIANVTIVAGHLVGDKPSYAQGLRMHTHEVRRLLPLPRYMGLLSRDLVGELRRTILSSDIVHVSYCREAIPLMATLLALRYRKRLILQPHGMLTARTTLFHRVVDIGVRRLARKAERIVALTPVEERDLARWIGAECEIVIAGNPVILDESRVERLQQTRRADEALFLARLHPRKRVGVFVDAARLSLARGWKGEYVVVGPDDGDLASVTQALIDTSNLSYEGVLPGHDVAARVARARVFVLTAESEPWGNVLVLALVLGVPVVLAESSALAPVVARYGAGLVVPDGDAFAVAQAVHELLTSKEKYDSAVAGAGQLAGEVLATRVSTKLLRQIYEAKAPRLDAGSSPGRFTV